MKRGLVIVLVICLLFVTLLIGISSAVVSSNECAIITPAVGTHLTKNSQDILGIKFEAGGNFVYGSYYINLLSDSGENICKVEGASLGSIRQGDGTYFHTCQWSNAIPATTYYLQLVATNTAGAATDCLQGATGSNVPSVTISTPLPPPSEDRVSCILAEPRYDSYEIKGVNDKAKIVFSTTFDDAQDQDAVGAKYFIKVGSSASGNAIEDILCYTGDEGVYISKYGLYDTVKSYICSWTNAIPNRDNAINVVVVTDDYDINNPGPEGGTWALCSDPNDPKSPFIRVIDQQRVCKDTDRGFDKWEKGTATGQLGSWCTYGSAICDALNTRTDSCLASNGNLNLGGPKVLENYCKSDGIWGTSPAGIQCEFGCFNGACKTQTCVDYDVSIKKDVSNPNVYLTPSYVSGKFNPNIWCPEGVSDEECATPWNYRSDRCTSDGQLQEFTCDREFISSEYVDCSELYGENWVCNAGKCVDTTELSCSLVVPSGPVTKVGSDSQSLFFEISGPATSLSRRLATGANLNYYLKVHSSDPSGWYSDFILCEKEGSSLIYDYVEDGITATAKINVRCDWRDKDAPTRAYGIQFLAYTDDFDPANPGPIGETWAECGITGDPTPIKVLGSYRQVRVFSSTVAEFGDGGQSIIASDAIVPNIIPSGSVENYKILFTNVNVTDAVNEGQIFDIVSAGGTAELGLSARPGAEPRVGDPFDVLKIIPGTGGLAEVVAGRCQPLSAGQLGATAGSRVDDNGVLKYCDPFSLNYIEARNVGASCVNDYECSSNVCVDGQCTSIREELERQGNLLVNIWCFISTPFTSETFDECVARLSNPEEPEPITCAFNNPAPGEVVEVTGSGGQAFTFDTTGDVVAYDLVVTPGDDSGDLCRIAKTDVSGNTGTITSSVCTWDSTQVASGDYGTTIVVYGSEFDQDDESTWEGNFATCPDADSPIIRLVRDVDQPSCILYQEVEGSYLVKEYVTGSFNPDVWCPEGTYPGDHPLTPGDGTCDLPKYTRYDRCVSDDRLQEFTCEGNYINSVGVTCSEELGEGYVCRDGACVDESGLCTSDEDCRILQAAPYCNGQGLLCEDTSSYTCNTDGTCSETPGAIICNECQTGTTCQNGACA